MKEMKVYKAVRPSVGDVRTIAKGWNGPYDVWVTAINGKWFTVVPCAPDGHYVSASARVVAEDAFVRVNEPTPTGTMVIDHGKVRVF
jgi:hypothetical protein